MTAVRIPIAQWGIRILNRTNAKYVFQRLENVHNSELKKCNSENAPVKTSITLTEDIAARSGP